MVKEAEGGGMGVPDIFKVLVPGSGILWSRTMCVFDV